MAPYEWRSYSFVYKRKLGKERMIFLVKPPMEMPPPGIEQSGFSPGVGSAARQAI